MSDTNEKLAELTTEYLRSVSPSGSKGFRLFMAQRIIDLESALRKSHYSVIQRDALLADEIDQLLGRGKPTVNPNDYPNITLLNNGEGE